MMQSLGRRYVRAFNHRYEVLIEPLGDVHLDAVRDHMRQERALG